MVNYLKETLYTERRHRHNAKFFNNLKGKIGKQKIGKNLEFIRAITEEWYGKIL